MPWWRFLLWNAAGGNRLGDRRRARRLRVRRAAADAISKLRALRRRSPSWSLIVLAFIGFKVWRQAIPHRTSADAVSLEPTAAIACGATVATICLAPLISWPVAGTFVEYARDQSCTSKEDNSWLGEPFSSATTVARKSGRTRARRCASRLRMHAAVRRSPISATTAPAKMPGRAAARRGRRPKSVASPERPREAGGARRRRAPQPPAADAAPLRDFAAMLAAGCRPRAGLRWPDGL